LKSQLRVLRLTFVGENYVAASYVEMAEWLDRVLVYDFRQGEPYRLVDGTAKL
jgi:hypothetical protein